MPASATSLGAIDHKHLLHPLHHPLGQASTRTWVSGRGAVITDDTGREHIDELAGLWCVNIGHGRTAVFLIRACVLYRRRIKAGFTEPKLVQGQRSPPSRLRRDGGQPSSVISAA
jgi:hypothetical protein